MRDFLKPFGTSKSDLTLGKLGVAVLVVFMCYKGCQSCNIYAPPESGSTTQTLVAMDTTTSEYVAHKLSLKKRLTKSEKIELKEARAVLRQNRLDSIANAKAQQQQSILSNFEQNCLTCKGCSCLPLRMLVENSLNDPGSFDHIETAYQMKGNRVLVAMKFRCKNAFNATITNYATAEVDVNCNLHNVNIDH